MSPAPIHHLDAILFDLDGVLIDTFDTWLNAYNSILQNQNKGKLSREKFTKSYWGKGLKKNLTKIDPSLSIYSFCKEIFPKFYDNVSIIDGSKEILNQLQSQYMLGIITNVPNPCAQNLLEKTSLKPYFDVIMTSDQVDNEKPAPDMILQACDILGISTSCAMYVGDTVTDVFAGNNAEITTVGVGVDAEFSIHQISELPSLLKRITKKIVETGEEPR